MKLIGKIFLSIIALIVLAVVLLVVLVDPNSFKPRIEAIAKEQGIALQMKGDIGWNFWPSIGVAINDVSIAAIETPTQPIAELQQASLMLALMPLFSGDFQVDHIAVDSAKINLSLDKNGKGNWEALQQNNKEPASTTAAQEKELKLSIDKISLTNSALHYADAKTDQQLAVHDINLSITDVNTRNEPFAIALEWAMDITQPGSEALQVQGKLNNRIALDEHLTQIILDQGSLQLVINNVTDTPIALEYSATLSDVQNELGYEGEVQLKPLNAKKLLAALNIDLETANKAALSELSFSSPIAGNTTQIALDDVKLKLDSTQFTGKIAIANFATTAIKLALKGDAINVDDYLPPEAETAQPEAVAATEDTPLPLEAMRTTDVDATITLASMRIKKMTLTDVELHVKAKNGIIDQSLSAAAYQGALSLSSKTEARTDKAIINFNGGIKGLELTPLLSDMDMNKKMDLSGAIQAQTQGAAQGASVNQLLESMNSTASFSGAQVRLSPLNIEEQFCKLVNLVTQQSSEAVTWDNFTELRQLEGNIVWRDQIINLEDFDAGVSQLLLSSKGKINLATNKYDFKLPIKLADASQAASLKGCSLTTTNYWVDRGLSLLRCSGSFDAIDPIKDCGFDKNALGNLTKDFAEYKLREKHGAKIEAAEKKLDDKKAEVKQQVADKKQELFNKLQSKLFKTEKSAASSSASSPAPATE